MAEEHLWERIYQIESRLSDLESKKHITDLVDALELTVDALKAMFVNHNQPRDVIERAVHAYDNARRVLDRLADEEDEED